MQENDEKEIQRINKILADLTQHNYSGAPDDYKQFDGFPPRSSSALSPLPLYRRAIFYPLFYLLLSFAVAGAIGAGGWWPLPVLVIYAFFIFYARGEILRDVNFYASFVEKKGIPRLCFEVCYWQHISFILWYLVRYFFAI